MQVLGIDHLGIAVQDLESALQFYETVLGLEATGIEVVEEQGVKVAFLPCGASKLELLEPTRPNSAVAKFIAKRGEGIQHLALRVADLEKALAVMQEKGICLLDQEPRDGAGGTRIAFLHPRSTQGVLLELTERQD